MVPVARALLIMGVVLIVISGVVYLAAKANLPLGRLPGDFRFQNENVTCIFPLATMILVSVILTILLNIIVRFFNR